MHFYPEEEVKDLRANTSGGRSASHPAPPCNGPWLLGLQKRHMCGQGVQRGSLRQPRARLPVRFLLSGSQACLIRGSEVGGVQPLSKEQKNPESIGHTKEVTQTEFSRPVDLGLAPLIVGLTCKSSTNFATALLYSF